MVLDVSTSAEARSFDKLLQFITREWGIEFPPGKQLMLEARLSKRARLLGLESLSAYYQYLQTSEGMANEGEHLVDAVTTHKTDFFREPGHFQLLTETLVPELERRTGAGLSRPLALWCAASSTGEEPYTLAMVLAEYARTAGGSRPFTFTIEATDISTVVLETARTAVYSEAVIAPVPEALRERYLLRSRNPAAAKFRIAPQLRAQVQFRRLNLLDADYGFSQRFDIVFCRNVMIYFDREKQQKIINRICRSIVPGGYLVMGHSESLTGMHLPLDQVATTVHRRRA